MSREKNYIFNPLGSTFKEGGVTLAVVEMKTSATCHGCWFASLEGRIRSCNIHGHMCTPYLRKDGRNVMFQRVK